MNKLRNARSLLAYALVTVMGASGCHMAQDYRADCVLLLGRPTRDGGIYSKVVVGNPSHPYAGQPAIRIRIDEQEVLLNEVTPAMLAPRLTTVCRGYGVDLYDWESPHTEIAAPPYHFVFSGNRVVQLIIFYPGLIGAGDSRPLYRLPLTHEQAVDLFGSSGLLVRSLEYDPM